MWDFIRENKAKIRDNIMSVGWTVFNTSFCEEKLYMFFEELALDFEVDTEGVHNFDKFVKYLQENAAEYIKNENYTIYSKHEEHFEIWVQNVHEISKIIHEYALISEYKAIPMKCTGMDRALKELSLATKIMAKEFTKAIQDEKVLKKILGPEYNFLDDEDYNMRYEY